MTNGDADEQPTERPELTRDLGRLVEVADQIIELVPRSLR
jgi:hypothetical protein